jgi:4-amino-4-deoxy-L-arabinose transferase-like glycosyltransferase
MKLLGPGALAVRLPSALGHVGTVLVVWAIARHLWDRRAALAAGAVAAVAPLALAMGTIARMEALLALLMTLMLLAALKLLDDRPRSWRWTLVLYGAAGLGLLTKGPVAVVLPALAILAALVLCGRLREIGRLRPVAGLVIVLAVAAPWYLYMNYRYPWVSCREPGFWHEFFISQNFGRATAGGFGHNRQFPGFLLAVFLAGMGPWAIFLPGLAADLFRAARRAVPDRQALAALLRGERREQAGLVLLILWAAAIVGAFSLSKTQLPHYVAPAVPPMAVLLGWYLADRTRPEARDRLFTIGLWIATLAGAGAVAAILAGVDRHALGHVHRLALLVVLAGIVVAGVATLVQGRRAAAVTLLAAGTACLLAFTLTTDPYRVFSTSNTLRESATILRSAQADDVILAYPRVPYSAAWYLWPHPIEEATTTGTPDGYASLPHLIETLNQPRRTWCLLQKKDLLDVLKTEVRWPIEVVSRAPDHTLLLVAPVLGPEPQSRRPPAAEEAPHGP